MQNILAKCLNEAPKESENSRSEDFTTYNLENEGERTQGEKGSRSNQANKRAKHNQDSNAV